jgi:hypothetical protein
MRTDLVAPAHHAQAAAGLLSTILMLCVTEHKASHTTLRITLHMLTVRTESTAMASQAPCRPKRADVGVMCCPVPRDSPALPSHGHMNETIQDVLLYYRYLHALDIIRTD